MASGLLEQWAQPYYVVNGAVLASWLVLRLVLPGASRLTETGSFMGTKEFEILGLCGFATLGKVRRASSTHEFATKVFLYGKVCMGLLLYRTSWVALGAYLCVLAVLFVRLPPPTFAGEECIVEVDSQRLRNEILAPFRGPDKSTPLWVVMLTAEWCETCTLAMPLYCSLAAEHSSTRRKFARVDVARHYDVAQLLGVDVSHRTRQLPTFLLVHDGNERRRLPFVQDGKVVKTRFTRESLGKYFALDRPPKDVIAQFKTLDAAKAAAAENNAREAD